MKKYYKNIKIFLLVSSFIMTILGMVCSFCEEWAWCATSFGVAALLSFYWADMKKAEDWYDLMNDYWDAIKQQDKALNLMNDYWDAIKQQDKALKSYEKTDSLADQALKIAESLARDNEKYLKSMEDLNELVKVLIDDIGNEDAAAINEKIKGSSLYLEKHSGKWVLCTTELA